MLSWYKGIVFIISAMYEAECHDNQWEFKSMTLSVITMSKYQILHKVLDSYLDDRLYDTAANFSMAVACYGALSTQPCKCYSRMPK